jgi:hypothetical protein
VPLKTDDDGLDVDGGLEEPNRAVELDSVEKLLAGDGVHRKAMGEKIVVVGQEAKTSRGGRGGVISRMRKYMYKVL